MPYELSLRSLRALVCVAETGSVKRAAELMHLTQPALSQHLARVSEKYGAPVVERHGRGIQLTEVGRVIVAHARDVQRSLEAADLAVGDLHGLLRGRVRIGMLQSFNMNVFPRVARQLRARYPGLRTEAYELSGGEIEHAVISGDLDLGLGLVGRRQERLHMESIYTDTIVLAGQAAAVSAVPASGRLADLTDLPLALLSNQFSTRRLIDFHCAEAGITLYPVIETNTISALLELIRDGDMLSLLPYTALIGKMGEGLSLLPLQHPRIQRNLALLQRKDAIASPAATAFTQAVREVAVGLREDYPDYLVLGTTVPRASRGLESTWASA